MTGEPPEEDRQLVLVARAGKRQAFEQLVARHKATLYRLARRYVGDAEDAYDIVQETFVAAWLALGRFDCQQSFIVWLRTIALNKCRDHRRRGAVRRRILSLFAQEAVATALSAATDSEREREVLTLRRLRQIDRAVAELPRLYKEPLLLTAVSGLTQQEAARELGISTKAVEMRMRRAREKLREMLGSLDERENKVR